jgi:hypothetical protein
MNKRQFRFFLLGVAIVVSYMVGEGLHLVLGFQSWRAQLLGCVLLVGGGYIAGVWYAVWKAPR